MRIVGKPKALHWTTHARAKMRYYQLSEARARRVLHTPVRVEEGVAPNTLALMQVGGTGKHPYEIWVMIQEEPKRRKVISVWRYPGTTKPRDAVVWGLMINEYQEFKHGSMRKRAKTIL